MTLLDGLNEPQKTAVLTTEGALLVLAGAGSGKTSVLTRRIAYLIGEKGVPPWKILAITFTNKAAKEMRERLTALQGGGADETWVSTFHSMCVRILRRDIEKLGYSRGFSIYDEDDAVSLLREILKQMSLSDKFVTPKDAKYIISDAKNKMQSPGEFFNASSRDYKAQKMHDIYIAYEKKLKTNGALDFDDLILKTLELFEQHPPVLEYYRDRFEYIHVDEYQDTNLAQYLLVRLLGGKHGNVCVVGDDDQSIYGWRGADIRNILEFEKDYKKCAVVKLEQNYRSVGHILSAANGIISNNFGRKSKKLWSDKPAGDKILDITVRDEGQEAYYCLSDIRRQLESGSRPADIAILYRMNAQSRVLEESFIRAGLPYRVYGGQRFYDRKEIRDLLGYFKLVCNPNDDVSLLRIINTPRRGIGDTTIETLKMHAQDTEESLFALVLDPSDVPGLNTRARSSLEAFAQMMTDMLAIKETLALDEFARHIVHSTGIKAQFAGKTDEDSVSRIENIDEFLGAVSKYTAENPEGSLEDYLENVALLSEADRDDGQGAVTLMTIHSAKGLEFQHVYVAGMEENIFPGARSVTDAEKLEEERRLCYVAVTRAKQRLTLVHARRRTLFGSEQANAPSRFLREIATADKESLDITKDAAPTSGQHAQSRYEQQSRFDIITEHRSVNMSRERALDRPAVVNGGTSGDKRIFALADKVSHPTFGNGTVVGVKGGSRQIVRVAFENRGIKELDCSVAPLSLLN